MAVPCWRPPRLAASSLLYMIDLIVSPVEVTPARPVQAGQEVPSGTVGPTDPVETPPPVRVHAVDRAVRVVPSPEAGFLDRPNVVGTVSIQGGNSSVSRGPARPVEWAPPIRSMVVPIESRADSVAIALPVTPGRSTSVTRHGNRAVIPVRTTPCQLSGPLVDKRERDTW